jgi:signal transduction histidine kinase
LELERSLRQSEKLATIGQLASELAHEIGTPLNIIGGRAELTLRRIEDPETIRKNLDIIARQTERITKIIQQLLGFVRKKRVEKRPLNIPFVLENTLTLLEQKIENQRVRILKNLPGNLPAVQGDPDQLQQVFLNLILNALQAMPRGGTLSLSASSGMFSREGQPDRRRPYVEVLVGDTGEGMEKEVLNNIFTPFFTTKAEEKGTGLGLTVSQGIVQEHEGWIEVKSEVSKGSLFRIYLPAAESGRKGDRQVER